MCRSVCAGLGFCLLSYNGLTGILKTDLSVAIKVDSLAHRNLGNSATCLFSIFESKLCSSLGHNNRLLDYAR